MSGKHYIHCEVPEGLKQAIEQQCHTGQTLKQIVIDALQQYLQMHKGSLFQASTINALVEGINEGDTTVKELKKHGDFGIGTFDDLEGEMIELDGKFYQIKSDGHAYPVKDYIKTPFATVTFWEPDVTVLLNQSLDYTRLQEYLDDLIPSQNMFYAIKIQGSFEYVQTRSVPKQRNHTRLAEVAAHQSTFEFSTLKEPWLVSGLLLLCKSMFQATISTSLRKTVRWVVICLDVGQGKLRLVSITHPNFRWLYRR